VVAKRRLTRQAGRVIRPWPTISSQFLADYRVFRVRRDRKQSPRTGQTHEFYVLECPSWVNVIALTPEQQVILVEQYRQGTDTVELEIPGGVMDPGDSSPVATARRELIEETGYEGQNARVISAIAPNPAIMNNTAYTVLIENCRLKHAVQFDHSEDVLTRLAPVAELPALVAAGEIRHSLIIAALYRYELLRKR
jgi:8-oxo-dGTP pyrophosphatase MutT (NUDIX family)